MELGLKNKRVLVVGASKGIGRAIALAFSAENCHVVAVARSVELLTSLKEEGEKKGYIS